MRSEPRLFHYIRQYREKDHTWNQIEAYLARRGYTERDIAEAIADYREAKDLHSEAKLAEYIEIHLKRGFTLQKLIDHLLRSKVDTHLVQRAVLRINTEEEEQSQEQPEESVHEPQDPLVLTVIFACFMLSFLAEIFIFASFLMLGVFVATIFAKKKLARVLAGVGTFAFLLISTFYQPPYSLAAAALFLLTTLLQIRKGKRKKA